MLTHRKLVMPGDENPAKRLFGGRLMQWADEATALYAMCQMRTKSLVTLKISEVLFKNPARSGDILSSGPGRKNRPHVIDGRMCRDPEVDRRAAHRAGRLRVGKSRLPGRSSRNRAELRNGFCRD